MLCFLNLNRGTPTAPPALKREKAEVSPNAPRGALADQHGGSLTPATSFAVLPTVGTDNAAAGPATDPGSAAAAACERPVTPGAISEGGHLPPAATAAAAAALPSQSTGAGSADACGRPPTPQTPPVAGEACHRPPATADTAVRPAASLATPASPSSRPAPQHPAPAGTLASGDTGAAACSEPPGVVKKKKKRHSNKKNRYNSGYAWVTGKGKKRKTEKKPEKKVEKKHKPALADAVGDEAESEGQGGAAATSPAPTPGAQSGPDAFVAPAATTPAAATVSTTTTPTATAEAATPATPASAAAAHAADTTRTCPEDDPAVEYSWLCTERGCSTKCASPQALDQHMLDAHLRAPTPAPATASPLGGPPHQAGAADAGAPTAPTAAAAAGTEQARGAAPPKPHKPATQPSQFKGVYGTWNAARTKCMWVAQITVAGKKRTVGRSDDPAAAARAYDDAARTANALFTAAAAAGTSTGGRRGLYRLNFAGGNGDNATSSAINSVPKKEKRAKNPNQPKRATSSFLYFLKVRARASPQRPAMRSFRTKTTPKYTTGAASISAAYCSIDLFFLLFFCAQAVRAKVLAENPGATVPFVAKRGAELWGKMPEEEKLPYDIEAANDKARYHEEMQKFAILYLKPCAEKGGGKGGDTAVGTTDGKDGGTADGKHGGKYGGKDGGAGGAPAAARNDATETASNTITFSASNTTATASREENAASKYAATRKLNRETGFVGVHENGNNTWTAVCHLDRKRHHIGTYVTKEQARAAREGFLKAHRAQTAGAPAHVTSTSSSTNSATATAAVTATTTAASASTSSTVIQAEAKPEVAPSSTHGPQGPAAAATTTPAPAAAAAGADDRTSRGLPKSGHVGIVWHSKHGKWQVSCKEAFGKWKCIGVFHAKDEARRAQLAYQAAQARNADGAAAAATTAVAAAVAAAAKPAGSTAPPGRPLPFSKALKFVWGLQLRSMQDWVTWSRGSARPCYIPADPETAYAGAGWR